MLHRVRLKPDPPSRAKHGMRLKSGLLSAWTALRRLAGLRDSAREGIRFKTALRAGSAGPGEPTLEMIERVGKVAYGLPHLTMLTLFDVERTRVGQSVRQLAGRVLQSVET